MRWRGSPPRRLAALVLHAQVGVDVGKSDVDPLPPVRPLPPVGTDHDAGHTERELRHAIRHHLHHIAPNLTEDQRNRLEDGAVDYLHENAYIHHRLVQDDATAYRWQAHDAWPHEGQTEYDVAKPYRAQYGFKGASDSVYRRYADGLQ